MRALPDHLVPRLAAISLAAVLASAACAGPRARLRPEQFFRVGVAPQDEAAAVERALAAADYRLLQRIERREFIALAFVRDLDDHRAIRIVTRLGTALAIDSHEGDGVRVRDGRVRVAEDAPLDLERDGRPDVVIAREEDGRTCLRVVRIEASGAATVVPIESIMADACPTSIEDLDGDGEHELLVELAWPRFALGPIVPAVRAVLTPREGAWRADGLPSDFAQAELAAREEALAAARERLDVDEANRLGVELAALANLNGAPIARHVERYDEALRGLVLDASRAEHVRAVRAAIASGWR